MSEISEATALINNSIGRIEAIREMSFPSKEAFNTVLAKLNVAVSLLNKVELENFTKNLQKEPKQND